jgi:pimeloyl-ACP methyl ester carboxylesterase
MAAVETSVGTIEYRDTGGNGPIVVLLHGLLMDASLWDAVIGQLEPHCRCIAPTLPLGAHRHPVHDGTALSLEALAQLVVEFLELLRLDNVVLVGNDTGGAIAQVLVSHRPEYIDRLVLVACEAFENMPPGATGRTLAVASKLPTPLFGVFMQQLRLRPVRRLPIVFGWLTKRGDNAIKNWLRPIWTMPGIRRDTVRMLRAVLTDTAALSDAATRLGDFHRPSLVIWADNDRVMPPKHGHRLASILPHGRLVTVTDSYTLIPLDQPSSLAQHLREFAC